MTDVAAIKAELHRARRTASHDVAEASANAVTLNFVVYSGQPERHKWVVERSLRIAAKHPARLIVLDATAGGEAAVVTLPRNAAHSNALSERIELPVRGVDPAVLRSVVQELLLRDVPTVVWWAASGLTAASGFAGLTELATSIVVDSSGSARDQETIAELLDFAERFPAIAIRDLAFMRLAPWQETIAQFFDDPDLFDDVFAISRLEVDAGSQAEGLYLAGWLASRLEWTARDRRSFGTRDGRTIPFVERTRGEQRRVLRVALGTPNSTYVAAVSDADERVVCLSVEGAKARSKPCVPLQSIDNASLIERAILQSGRDQVFETSLATVRGLLG